MLEKLKSLFARPDDNFDRGVSITVHEAAVVLNVTDRRVRQLIETGIIPGVKEWRSRFDKHGQWTVVLQDVLAHNRARKSRAEHLKRWRMAWARGQNEKRRRIAELRKMAERRKRHESQD